MPGVGCKLNVCVGWLCIVFGFLSFSFLFPTGVQAEAIIPEILEKNVLLEADSISYDEEMLEVVATGDVSISMGDSTVLADKVTYNRRADQVSAIGNVVLLSPDGNVTFSQAMDLTGDLKSGTIEAIKILFVDGSRLAANGGKMTRNGRSEVNKAVYSPCAICANSESKKPLWQIKAVNVVHDKSLRRIFYKDAILEVFGLPVMYVPFFTHPDPSVERKTGFLAPSAISNSLLGLSYKQPFFFNIADNEDATIAPIFSSSVGIVLTGEYRRVMANGSLELSGSAVRAGKVVGTEPEVARGVEETRGHLFAKGVYSLGNSWLAGMDVKRSSDHYYLGNFGFSPVYDDTDIVSRYRGQSHLTSQVFLERVAGRNYTNVAAVAFQSLNPAIGSRGLPYLLPVGTFSYRGQPGASGDYWLFDANLRLLGREEGTQSKRLIVKGGWRIPYTSAYGAKYFFNLGLRADGYHLSDFPESRQPGATTDGFESRLLPEIHVDWRLPLARPVGSGLLIVEPISQVVWRPNGGDSNKIPNEDSLAFEFDDLNLLSVDRFPGLDRYEGGGRLNYGLRSEINSTFLPDSEMLVGQVLRARVDETYSDGTGLNQKLSDFVGRFTIAPSRLISLVHRFRLDRSNLATRSSSFRATVGPSRFNGSVHYMKLSDDPTDGLPFSTENLNIGLNMQFPKDWHWRANHDRRLGKGGGAVSTHVGLVYVHDCLTLETYASRNYTRGPLLAPDTTLGVQISLKNLGQSVGHQVNLLGGNP
tara:strand:- start:1014 stop:3287 length:2274 start_codon:yes stop_codon:yes gene_type:complete